METEKITTIEEYIDYLVNWLKICVNDAKADGLIVGISGGIDSAVVAYLIKKAFPNNCLGLIMPCNSDNSDLIDGELVAKTCEIDYQIIDLTSLYNHFINNTLENRLTHLLAKGNSKARFRMTTLYALGQNRNYLVVGTDNAAEWHTGYFTKYGDGGVDLAPLINLTKTQVYQLAKYLNIPESIINKKPTAGLIDNSTMTDEEEMGISYQDIDDYLMGKRINEKAEETLNRLHQRSAHKRSLAKVPSKYLGYE